MSNNSDERLLQILEDSACLSKGQLLGYINNTLYPEELRAVELHLSGCVFCNDALDGMEQQKDVEKLLKSLVPPTLPAVTVKEKPKEKKEPTPTAKLERPVMPAKAATSNKTQISDEIRPKNATNTPVKTRNFYRPLGIAAILLIGFGLLWYVEFRPNDKKQLAQYTENASNDTMSSPVNEVPTTAAQTKVSQNTDSLRAIQAAAQDELLQMQAKVHKDSLALAKSIENKAKNKNQDSGRQLLAAKNAETQAEKQSVAMMSKTVADQDGEKEDKKNLAESANMAAKALDKTKEEQPEKSEKEGASDFETGLKLYKQKQYASALLYFRSAESDKSDSKHWDAVYYSALCNKNLNKTRRAKKLFERVVEGNAPQKKAAQKQLDDMKKADN